MTLFLFYRVRLFPHFLFASKISTRDRPGRDWIELRGAYPRALALTSSNLATVFLMFQPRSASTIREEIPPCYDPNEGLLLPQADRRGAAHSGPGWLGLAPRDDIP